MLSDEQFIEQVRAELHAGMEVLRPSQELLEANGRLPDGSRVRPDPGAGLNLLERLRSELSLACRFIAGP